MDDAAMMVELSWPRIMLGDEPFVLVLDSYATHFTPHVRDKAEALGIEFPFGPVGRAGNCRHLGRGRVRPINGINHRLLSGEYIANRTERWSHGSIPDGYVVATVKGRR
jgi:hypothetical protein